MFKGCIFMKILITFFILDRESNVLNASDQEEYELYKKIRNSETTKYDNRSFKWSGERFSFKAGEMDIFNVLEQQAVEQLLKVNNSIIIVDELPSPRISYFREFVGKSGDETTKHHAWYLKLRDCMLQSGLEEVLQIISPNIPSCDPIWVTMTRGELYADVINPALGIILNHLTFPEELFRAGSLKDVEDLSFLFMKKNIPHIVVQDGQMEHDNAILNILQKEEFNDLKDIYIFIMSHGEENDIIKSGGDQYSLYGRLQEVLKNSSLKNVNKIFFVNACRGKLNPAWDSIVPEKTDARMLDERTVVIHSVPKHYISLRTDDGAVFVQHVKKVLDEPFDELPVDDLVAKIDKKVENCPYYSEYDDNQRFDYVKKEETAITLTSTTGSASELSFYNPYAKYKILARNKRN